MNCSTEIPVILRVGARGSALSRAQVEEVLGELKQHHPNIAFDPLWVATTGDKDLTTSLRSLERTDFFTREIDALQLSHQCRISIHSAKDLSQPLPRGLELIALTKGVDPSDVLVLRDADGSQIQWLTGAVRNQTLKLFGYINSLQSLPLCAKIGTSSIRREKSVRALRSDLVCVDVRGDIFSRLALLDRGDIDGLVMAEAALIRLKLTHRRRIPLPGEPAEGQGRLAVLARTGDEKMQQLFSCIDMR